MLGMSAFQYKNFHCFLPLFAPTVQLLASRGYVEACWWALQMACYLVYGGKVMTFWQ